MKDFIIKKGYTIDLIVKEDDHKLIKISKKFIKILEEEYEKYKEKLKNNQIEYEKYLKDSRVYFSQEKLLKKSPLAILNAPWGSGKTYFIEQFAKNFIDNKIKIKFFKKIIILDTWKYSNSKNITDDIMSELFSIICEINKEKKLKEKLGKFAVNVFNSTAISWINYYAKTDIPKLKIKERKELEKLIEDISENIDKTIIIFDNIERIGKYSWEIIKAIFKISQIDNLCFILPMNINKLENNENYKNEEYPIEKYVDLLIFDFKQDYLSFLKNNGIKEEAILINNILNKEINGQKLSIREVEQRFNANNILKEENKYLKINKIINKIWGSIEEAKKELINDDNLKYFFNKLLNLKKIHNEFKEIFTKNETIRSNTISYSYSYTTKKSYIYKGINDKLNKSVEFFINNNWNYFNNYIEWINEYKIILIEIKKYLNKLKKNNEKENNEINILLKEEKNIKNKVKKLEKEINEESNKEIGNKENKKIATKKVELKEEIEDLKKITNKINDKKKIIEEKKELISKLDQEKNLETLILDYEKIVKDIDNEINGHLIKKYEKWNNKFNFMNEYSNFSNNFMNELLI